MTSAKRYDESDPKVLVFATDPSTAPAFDNDFLGYDSPWYVDYDDFRRVQIVGCLAAIPGTVRERTCRIRIDGQRVVYRLLSYEYTLRFVAARTGAVYDGSEVISAGRARCPEFILTDRGEDQVARPDDLTVERAVDRFLGT